MNKEDHFAYIEAIIASKSFGRSDTYANLLRFLMKSSLEHNVPKETTIASEIFGKPEFDPSQSTLIRVYVYNLRKKLKTYYQNEGVSDERTLHIPKGSYKIEFRDRNTPAGTITKSVLSKWGMLFLILAILSLSVNVYLIQKSNNQGSLSKNGLWGDLIKSERSLMVVLGDLFVYSEVDSANGLNRTIRDPAINSITEFDAFKIAKERENVVNESITYTHLVYGSAFWIKNLTQILFSEHKSYSIHTVSRFNLKELQDHDFIVVGMIKTLGVFNLYLKNSRILYDADEDALLYTPLDKTPTVVYKPKGDADTYHTDYGFMAKYPGPNNNSIYYFGGLWDTGATQSLKHFTDSKLRTELEQEMLDKLGNLPSYYEVLFEVNGVDRMELSSKILHIIEVDPTQKIN